MIFLVLCVIVVWLFRPVLNVVNSTCPHDKIDSKRRVIYITGRSIIPKRIKSLEGLSKEFLIVN